MRRHRKNWKPKTKPPVERDPSGLFIRAYAAKVRKGAVLFSMKDPDVCIEVIRRNRRLIKAKNLKTEEILWIASMKFDHQEFYYLER